MSNTPSPSALAKEHCSPCVPGSPGFCGNGMSGGKRHQGTSPILLFFALCVSFPHLTPASSLSNCCCLFSVPRACKFCARSHLSCSTFRPCARCKRRGIACVDPPSTGPVHSTKSTHPQVSKQVGVISSELRPKVERTPPRLPTNQSLNFGFGRLPDAGDANPSVHAPYPGRFDKTMYGMRFLCTSIPVADRSSPASSRSIPNDVSCSWSWFWRWRGWHGAPHSDEFQF